MLHSKTYPAALAIVCSEQPMPPNLWITLNREEQEHLNDLVAAAIQR